MSILGRFGFLTVVALAFALLAAHPATSGESGGGGTRSLQGEDFLVQDVNVTAECNQDGVSTVRYTATGPAIGPYPGTFFLSGRVTIGPQEFEGPLEGTVAGPVLTLSEGFVVFSPLATITGSKTLPENIDPSVSQGTCMEVTDFPGSGTVVVVSTQPRYDATITGSKTLPENIDPSVSQGTCMEVTDFPGSGTVVVVSTQPRYDATIHEPLGTFHDEGDALLSFTEIDLDVGRIAGFDQFFLQSDPSPPPDDDDDDDDDD
jgi:hypothetical protein